MIALWLSYGFSVPAQQLTPSSTHADLGGAFLQAAFVKAQSPAILPGQQLRSPTLRPIGPVGDGSPVILSRCQLDLARSPHPRSDAPGLAPLALAQNWQLVLRAAPFPRSPSLA